MSLLKPEAVTQVSYEHIKEEISQKSCVPCVATRDREELHRQKLNNPEKFVKDRSQRSPGTRQGVLRH
jgi:hypothetical protein